MLLEIVHAVTSGTFGLLSPLVSCELCILLVDL